MKTILAAAGLLAVSSISAYAQDARDALPGTDILPEGTIQVSPVIPGMGEHWANPGDLPLGPIYCVHEGKIVCLEFMMPQEEFSAGKSWTDLSGIPDLPSIDHVNIDFEANGHEGFEVPHYDVHLYFIDPAEQKAIQ